MDRRSRVGARKAWLVTRLRPTLIGLRDAWIGDDPEVSRLVDRSRVLERMELFLKRLPGFYLTGLVFGIWIFDWISPIEIGRLPPFRKLRQPDRERCLDRWAHARLGLKRLVFMGIKFVTASQIYTEPALLESLGYGPALRDRKEGRCQ